MANFIQNVVMFFEQPKDKKELSSLDFLKRALDSAIVRYQLATGAETANSIVGISNAIDLIRIEGKEIRNLTDLRNKISRIKNEENVWQIVTELLDTNNPVLKLCISSALAAHLGETQKFTLKDKAFAQLQDYASSPKGKKLIDHILDTAREKCNGKKGLTR